MRSLGLVVVLLLSSLTFEGALADGIRGQDDPQFQASLELWLNDDDAVALPQLAALAAEGNRAAQVLLGLIDLAPPLQGPWVAALPRRERTALMRAPGGLSGRSWMEFAAEDTALAEGWVKEATPAADAETAREFAALGEARATRVTLAELSRRQFRSFAEMADDPGYPPEMRYLIWREWSANPEMKMRLEAEISGAHPGDPQLQRFDSRPIDRRSLEDWLDMAALAAPVRGPCAAMCPETARACTMAAFELLGGSSGAGNGHVGLASIGTPSETIVPAVVWNGSPRGRTALLRQSDARFDPDAPSRASSATDACLARAIEDDAKLFSR
jgi:hypothetical protein